MQEVTQTYEQFRDTLGAELQKQADGFVKIGYLLKIARDTDILYKSGYANLVEFAKGEFNLTKDVVSRYIAINDRYSENGYSECLKEEFKGYGVAKLAEMLTLSDEVIQSLSPELTKKEIKEIKKEIKEEEQITDIEVALEDAPDYKAETLIDKAMHQYLKENKELFEKLYDTNVDNMAAVLIEAMAPSAIGTLTVRVPGTGKILISIKGMDEKIDFVNVRTNEKESQNWTELTTRIQELFTDLEASEAEPAYEELFGEQFGEKKKYKETVTNTEENKETVSDDKEEGKENTTEIEKVTGEVVEDLKEIKEALAEEFIKRYTTRLEYSENMKDETREILDRVHKSEWTFNCNGEEYFAVEFGGYIKVRQKEEITAFFWADFYEIMHKVYWKEKENYIPHQEEEESCTGATQIPGQMTVEEWEEETCEGAILMENWERIKDETERRIKSMMDAVKDSNVALVRWEYARIGELLKGLKHGE